jgi:TolA-binding protein
VTGQTVTHYRVGAKIGEGAHAVVYRAVDLSLGREVVLKFLSPTGSDDAARFLHEARTISTLNHPNICTIYEIGEHDGRYFLAIELLEGEVLANAIARHPLTTERLIDIGTQVADALDAAHIERIVHRDLKPANIFITRAGRIKLLDFGVALLLPARARLVGATRQTTAKSGTIPYMSPEQAQAEDLDHRSDLFSFGVVLYEMATGRRPFVATTAPETVSAIATRAPIAPRDINPLVPPGLERIIARALEKKRELRYQTASDLRADLQRLKRDIEGTAALELARSGYGPTSVRTTYLLAVAAVGVLLVCGLGWFLLAGRTRPGMSIAPTPIVKPTQTTLGAGAVSSPVLTSGLSTPPPRPTAAAVTSGTKAVAVSPAPRPSSGQGSSAQLSIAAQQIDLKLYDQAIGTLRPVAASADRTQAIEASFRIASIQTLQGETAAAMGTYVEIAARFAGDARAPEALFRLAQSTMSSRRKDNERDALRTIDTLVSTYPSSVWAPRALLTRADIEARQGTYQRDEESGGSVPVAAVTCRRIVERYPSSDATPAALQKLAGIYVDQKRYADAARTFEALAAHDVDGRYDAWFAAAQIYDKHLKDPVRARADYARVPASSARYADAIKRK